MTPFRLRERLRALLAAPPPPRTAPPPPPEPEVPPEDPLEVDVPVPGSLLLDIREPGELSQGVGEGSLLLPMNLVPHHLDRLPRDRAITVVCAAGARSYGVASWLRDMGFPLAVSLSGGTGALRAAGVRFVVPPGAGEAMRVPASATADGVPLGHETTGEVLRRDGDVVEVVIQDAQGLPVLVRVS